MPSIVPPVWSTHEKDHVKAVLKDNGYTDWIMKTTMNKKKRETTKKDKEQSTKPACPLPYIQGVSEKLERIYKKYGAKIYHKPYNTLRNILVNPKDKTPIDKKSGVVYKIECGDCDLKYIGETKISIGERISEHRKQGSGKLTAVGEHLQYNKHKLKKDSVSIVTRESRWLPRKIRESIEIFEQKPRLNRGDGYELPAVYQTLLSCETHISSHSN